MPKLPEPKLRSFPQPYAGSLLIAPNDGLPHPGIVTLHGSEGGGHPAWKMTAQKWAAEGYAVLAFCYFGATDQLTGPRATLADIEVNDVLEALRWLKNSEFVQGRKVALDGTSRGAELALLAASLLGESAQTFDIDAVTVHSPASSVWGPWNHDWIDTRC